MQHDKTNSITLVLGGVRSGKSSFAQRMAEHADTVTFVATAECRDDEMQVKIDRHRADRPAHWTTIEEPFKLAEVLAYAEPTQTILIDCLTLYAANLLELHGGSEAARRQCVDELCSALSTASCSVILVSNEVGSGVVPAYALGRQFRDLAGEINQRIAALADCVILMIAGLPLVLKGQLEAAINSISFADKVRVDNGEIAPAVAQ